MSDDIGDLKNLEREAADEVKLDPDKGVAEVREHAGGHDRDRGIGPWVPGLVLIGLGAYFLLRNFTDFELDNWWALFILIPAFGSLGKFMSEYRRTGRIDGNARGALIGGLIFLFVAAIFLFGLNWGTVWPVFLIIAGLGALLSGLFG